MKKVFYLLTAIMLPMSGSVYAQDSYSVPDTTANAVSVTCRRSCDFAHSIDILGFEKRLNDRNELFIIRNNTDETVTLIKLRVYYKTPKNEMLDYREVVITGELLPHTTRQFETPSFDAEKRYYFVDSRTQNKKLEGYPFKITYDLIRYDIAITE